MGEETQGSWEETKARMDRKVKVIDEINRILRRKNLDELREIRDELRFE